MKTKSKTASNVKAVTTPSSLKPVFKGDILATDTLVSQIGEMLPGAGVRGLKVKDWNKAGGKAAVLRDPKAPVPDEIGAVVLSDLHPVIQEIIFWLLEVNDGADTTADASTASGYGFFTCTVNFQKYREKMRLIPATNKARKGGQA